MDRLIFECPVRVATSEEHRKMLRLWRRRLRETLLNDARTRSVQYVKNYDIGRGGE